MHTIEEARPVAVLVSLNLRRDNPFDLIRAVKALPAASTLPIMAFAGHVETGKHQQAREAGADKVAANSSVALHLAALLAGLLTPHRSSDEGTV